MASAVDQARKAGYTDQEIFSFLTKGREKELESARAAGYNDDQILSFLSEGEVSGKAPDELAQRRVERARQQSDTDRLVDSVQNNPTAGMSMGQLMGAGFGKSFVDAGRGARQIGAKVADAVAPREQTIADLVAGRDPSRSAAVQAEVDESRELDRPLMRTGAGQTGNIAGTVAQTAPLMMLPGGQTIAGSALTGAGIGAVQPTATGESRALNTLVGAAAGGAAPVIARTAGAVWRGGKALAEPLTEGGRQRIAGRVLQRFGVEPSDLAGVTDAPTATGARLTLPEQITRPEGAAGAARLMDDIRAQNPEFAAKLAAREGENNAARVGVLERLESMNGGRATAEKLREETAKTLYKESFKGKINVDGMTPQERGEFTKVLKMPAVQQGIADAGENMANKGLVGEPKLSMRALHETKLAMDDAIARLNKPDATAAQVNKMMSIKMARDRLVTFMERHSHGENYKYARQFYAEQSKPINQADIAGELLRKGSSNTTDLSGNARLMPNSLTREMADEGALIRRATGRNLGANLSDVLEPDQLAAVNAVVGEVDRAAAVGRAANGPGSATAKRLAGSNVIQQTLERSGLPAGAADSVTVQEVLARPLNFLYKGAAEPKLQMTLGELLLDPSKASRAMAAASASQRRALSQVLSNRYLKQAARQSLPAAAQANRR